MRLSHIERLDIEQFLAELKAESQPCLFIPNSGNAGDALIGHATYEMFDRLNLNYQTLIDHTKADPSGRVVICGGGGNLVPLYTKTARVLRWASGRARRTILLPHTIDGNEELLAGLSPDVDLVCRERVSYDHVTDSVRSAKVHLADDMAFSMDVRRTLDRAPPVPAQLSLYAQKVASRLLRPSLLKTIPSPRKIRAGRRLMAGRSSEQPQGTLHAFRTDLEKTSRGLPDDNLDIARQFSHGTRDPYICHVSAFFLLSYVATFEAVETNRLHVSIGAALLGKKVTLWPNSYFKNQAVFEFSIREYFPDVRWAGAMSDVAH